MSTSEGTPNGTPSNGNAESGNAHSILETRRARVRQLSAPKLGQNDVDSDMMGSIVRRKKQMSLTYAGAFFDTPVLENEPMVNVPDVKIQSSSPVLRPTRTKQSSGNAGGGIIRRKQISLDLHGAQAHGFFFEDRKPNEFQLDARSKEDEPTGVEDIGVDAIEEKAPPTKCDPFEFEPKVALGGHGHGHGGHGQPAQASLVNDEDFELTKTSVKIQSQNGSKLKLLVERLKNAVTATQDKSNAESISLLTDVSKDIELAQMEIEKEQQILNEIYSEPTKDEKSSVGVASNDDGIIRATKRDYVVAGVLVCVMTILLGVIIGWETHIPHGTTIFGTVGLACQTPCEGDVTTRNFFLSGVSSFKDGDLLKIGSYIDPVISDDHHNDETHHETYLIVDIVSVDGVVKDSVKLGPAGTHERLFFDEYVEVDSGFESPSDEHILVVHSSGEDEHVELSFTLYGQDLSPLANYRIIIGALIMILVYVFIVAELIHRTLVAIFGSFVALLLYYLMNRGNTEEIAEVMLHMEWSTLGLLFGMMIIVGELSQTGIFEWCAVRLLFASKGSYKRLMVLLCGLTALSSAFLDNVTTMLLLAPVTIDMCTILNVDPRPYLIGEVILSNIGGTATLIGDPPNIIIGSDIEEVGFVDFIIYVAPCIMLLCVPIGLYLVTVFYKRYLELDKPIQVDNEKLRKQYPIYDEPRLIVSGVIAGFVILMFFLHEVHHTDTAWIALLGAFLTITFTHPHDVQTSLRGHVEWDTLLFFAGLFVLVEVVAAMGLLQSIGDVLADLIAAQPEDNQLLTAISLIIWVSAITSAFLDNIPYTATMIPVIKILADELPDTLDIKTLAWALSFGACLGGNGTLLGASANIVTAGIASSKGYNISFLNFFAPGMAITLTTIAAAHLYMLVIYVWA